MHVFLAAITGPLGASVASFRRRLLKNWEMFKMTKFECAMDPCMCHRRLLMLLMNTTDSILIPNVNLFVGSKSSKKI